MDSWQTNRQNEDGKVVPEILKKPVMFAYYSKGIRQKDVKINDAIKCFIEKGHTEVLNVTPTGFIKYIKV